MAKRKAKQESPKEEILGILLITLGLLIFIGLLGYDSLEEPGGLADGKISNYLGIAGVYIAHYLVRFGIGYPSIVIPIIILIIGWNLFRGAAFSKSLKATLYLFSFALYTSIILAFPEVISDGEGSLGFSLSGLIGGIIAQGLFDYLGIAGGIVVLLSLIMITVIAATNLSFAGMFAAVSDEIVYFYDSFRLRLEKSRERRVKKNKTRSSKIKNLDWQEEGDYVEPEPSPPPKINNPPRASKSQTTVANHTGLLDLEAEQEGKDDFQEAEELEMPEPKNLPKEIASGNYKYPPLEFLAFDDNADTDISQEELNANAQILEDRLLEFGVEGRVVEINPGPVITRYDIEPAAGVKISRIVSLSDDLALSMRAKRIRIVSHVPGKGAVGIEIPNRKHSVVYLKNILSSKAFRTSESPLTVALGETISGEPFVTNLEKMPHLLIAGATGAGKSVCINSIVASILYKAHPIQVQFVMVDPKRLELSVYNDLRHHHLLYREDLNEEVVTSAENAISILKSMCAEMDHRYEILARAGVRNISDYNRKFMAGQLQQLEFEEPYKHLPYIVLIIDELADLMLTSAREIEEPIARLAQMARAIGIHLIVATQRPSVNVITGVIKANFPARIAFQVASKIDSRTILDLNGAEKLLGMGDMLFVPQGSPEPVRIHGAYVAIEEIESIIKHIREQPRYPKDKLRPDEEEVNTDIQPGEIGSVSSDPMFNHALKLVVRHQQGSISLIQRRLKVGYARAARLIDELEAGGVVGPYDGSKAREVLMDVEELEEMDLG